MSRQTLTSIILFSLLPLAISSDAWSQGMPGGGQPMQGPRSGGTENEGVAEQAPKELGALPTTPVLPAPKESKKELRVFSLEGYFRLRTDWMKRMDLGFEDDPELGGAPFPDTLSCRGTSGCKASFGGANTRLRLEPTIHLDERSTVHMQVDVLDNLVLGSTNENLYNRRGDLPIGSFGDSQSAPLAGSNSVGDSIVVKRAWAEINAAFGVLKFGRQPWQWGMGIMANGGGGDSIHDSYNLDADFGDNVDRVSFSTAIPGTNLNASVAADWSYTGPTSTQTGEQQGQGRQSWDLDDTDDLDQWLLTISRMDSPKVNADRLAEGKAVLNYGGFLAYRTQGREQADEVFGETPDPANNVSRSLTAYVPDLWAHYAKGTFDIEAEVVGVFGTINTPDRAFSDDIDVRQFGGVARARYGLLDNDLTLAFEVGFASGDQYDNEVPGRTHISGAVGLGPGDNVLSQFIFDRDYNVDLILFEELLGAVTNATYTKPSFAYSLTEEFLVRGAGILAMAHKAVALPGNSTLYGLELDADVGYRSGNFSAGIAYGIFLPFAGMDHPAENGEQGPGFGFTGNSGTARIAQTIQTRLVLQF